MLPPLTAITARLRLKHFRLLVAIDECGTLLAAADRISMSQPAATKALQEIERALGNHLFERSNRGLEPTEAGLAVIRHSRILCLDLDLMRQELSDISGGASGTVSVGTIVGATPLVSDVLAASLRANPALNISLREGISAELLRLLDDGRIDMAICRPGVSAGPTNHRATLIRSESLSVIVGPNHPLAEAHSVTMAELRDLPWVVCEANMPTRRYLEQEFLTAGLPLPITLIETASTLAILNLITHIPSLCTLMSDDVVDMLAKGFGLVRLRISLAARPEPYSMVTRADRSLSPAAQRIARRFVEMTEVTTARDAQALRPD